MTQKRRGGLSIAGWTLCALLGATSAWSQGTMAGAPPALGSQAPDFTLKSLDGEVVTLSAEVRRGPVVLVVGRGYPGYQCPFCTRQFGELRGRAKEIEARGAKVLWVYPGPADDLLAQAKAFAGPDTIPPNFRILLDGGYGFTNAYGLRWDAPRETAYPATFVIDAGGVVRFAHVSREHGGRAPIADVLAALPAK